MDRGGGIWDFQHCIIIIRGQEERIPKTASVVGKKHEFGWLAGWLAGLAFHGFSLILMVFFLQIWCHNALGPDMLSWAQHKNQWMRSPAWVPPAIN